MKKVLMFCFLLLSLRNAFTSQIQIIAKYNDKKLLSSYDVYSWNGPDKAMLITNYTIQDAMAKFNSLLNGVELGTSKSPDRIFIDYDDNGKISLINAQVTSASSDNFEAVVTNSDKLSDQVKQDADATKTDVEDKTGNDLGPAGK